ncbi:MAG: sirohydrochlorin cobaltochelatase, partial [Lysobacterales bacterium]
MKAILLISHGSRSKKTVEQVNETLNRLKLNGEEAIYKYAFLELESPSISEGIEECILAGATEIVILLNFLNAGMHVDKDIPSIVLESQSKYPNIPMKITPPVGQHPNMI